MRPLIPVMFAVLGAVAIVDAQGQGRGRGNQPLVAPVPDPPAQTISGCLRPAPAGSLGFVLAEAEMKSGGSGGSTGTSGSKSTYSIVGMIPPDVKLSQHVNHR